MFIFSNNPKVIGKILLSFWLGNQNGLQKYTINAALYLPIAPLQSVVTAATHHVPQ